MIPVTKVTYALQSSLDRAIVQFTKNLNSNIKLKSEDEKKWQLFKESERGKVLVAAQIQQGLAAYRKKVKEMDIDERENESHSSTRLGGNMRAVGIPRPNYYYHAHAIISGGDIRAWRIRTVLAECALGVDDPYNGCWLPASSRHCGQPPYPKAVPHSRIHRENYYTWLNLRFLGVKTIRAMIERLSATRRDLLHSTFPKGVMLKKGEWKEASDSKSKTDWRYKA